MPMLGLSKWISAGTLLATASARAVSLPGDAEAATHGDEAANVQRVKETEQKAEDFVFRQYNLTVLSHYSYLIGSAGEAMIVDPARDIARYLKHAKELGFKIPRVYLTHSHADFVAGHMELAKSTGAKIVANAFTKAGYPHRPVKDGDPNEMTHPAQARDSLQRQGFGNVYMLTDGLQGFRDRCLKPVSLRAEPLHPMASSPCHCVRSHTR